MGGSIMSTSCSCRVPSVFFMDSTGLVSCSCPTTENFEVVATGGAPDVGLGCLLCYSFNIGCIVAVGGGTECGWLFVPCRPPVGLMSTRAVTVAVGGGVSTSLVAVWCEFPTLTATSVPSAVLLSRANYGTTRDGLCVDRGVDIFADKIDAVGGDAVVTTVPALFFVDVTRPDVVSPTPYPDLPAPNVT